jgi:NhaP-type Na+/H+ or K+/H+ antiporter
MDAWALAGIALVLIGYAAVSGRLATTPVTQAMVFVAIGLLAGNRALGLIEADAASQFVRHLAEATLTLVLFTDAVRVNLGRLRREALVPARLLGIGLPLTIVAGTVAGLACCPGWTCGRRPRWRPCWPRPTPPSGCRWSATGACRRASARASTSRAASTTACASRC